MIYVSLPSDEVRPLSFYLAMEEYVACHISQPDCFFIWQVEPTVIFGRNQVMESEVNLQYCREHGIQVFRRKSGGGCVYADKGNVMLSFVTSETNVNFAFNQFVNMLLLIFRQIGVDALSSSRNDVLIDGRKVCGTACYHLADRTILHSTLLYDTCMEHMLNAITPSPEKLRARGIQSVRQRITLLKDHTSLSLPEVKRLIRFLLCQEEITLTEQQVEEIRLMEKSCSDQIL